MNEKYYTPSIEEFHEGFVYEYSYNSGEFVETKFDIGSGDFDEFAGERHDFSPNNPKTICRVKYLDKQDIESLGWNYKREEPLDYFYFWSENKKHSLVFHASGKVIITKFDVLWNENITAFAGVIKNKSKLREIMQMIGI